MLVKVFLLMMQADWITAARKCLCPKTSHAIFQEIFCQDEKIMRAQQSFCHAWDFGTSLHILGLDPLIHKAGDLGKNFDARFSANYQCVHNTVAKRSQKWWPLFSTCTKAEARAISYGGATDAFIMSVLSLFLWHF